MIGFLLKMIIVAVVVVGGFSFLSHKNPNFIKDLAATKTKIQAGQFSQLADIDTSVVKNNVSATLDSLVTHNTSPVVLGVKISNDSLNSIVNFIQALPPDQVNELKSVICSPATDSAQK